MIPWLVLTTLMVILLINLWRAYSAPSGSPRCSSHHRKAAGLIQLGARFIRPLDNSSHEETTRKTKILRNLDAEKLEKKMGKRLNDGSHQ